MKIEFIYEKKLFLAPIRVFLQFSVSPSFLFMVKTNTTPCPVTCMSFLFMVETIIEPCPVTCFPLQGKDQYCSLLSHLVSPSLWRPVLHLALYKRFPFMLKTSNAPWGVTKFPLYGKDQYCTLHCHLHEFPLQGEDQFWALSCHLVSSSW